MQSIQQSQLLHSRFNSLVVKAGGVYFDLEGATPIWQRKLQTEINQYHFLLLKRFQHLLQGIQQQISKGKTSPAQIESAKYIREENQ